MFCQFSVADYGILPAFSSVVRRVAELGRVGVGKWRWCGRGGREQVRAFCCDCGEFVVDDGLFKESGSRELTEKESSQEKEPNQKDTNENANANASTTANPNVDVRVASGSISPSSSRTSCLLAGKGKDRREVILLATSLSMVASLMAEETISRTLWQPSRFCRRTCMTR